MPSTSISKLPFAIAWGAWIVATLVVELRWPQSERIWAALVVAFVLMTSAAIMCSRKQLGDLLREFLACGWSRLFLVVGWMSCILLRVLDSDPPEVVDVELPRILIVFGMAVWLAIHLVLRGAQGFGSLWTRCGYEDDGQYSPVFRVIWIAWFIATGVIEVAWPQQPAAWLAVLLVFVLVEGVGVWRPGKDTWSELVWETYGSGVSRAVVALPWIGWISLRLLYLNNTPPEFAGVPYARLCFVVCLVTSSASYYIVRAKRRSR